MKSVLISIQPKWCELIADGKKTVEVRKTKPKIDVPFKCYIYCTKPYTASTEDNFYIYLPPHDTPKRANGKVIGEFICDRIDNYECELWNDEAYELIRQFDYDEDGDIEYKHGAENNENCEMLNNACLTWQDIRKYLGNGINNCYAWHISNLVIYDKPKALSEFKPIKCEKNFDGECIYKGRCKHQVKCSTWGYRTFKCEKRITRAPQSWQFCEDLGV